MEMEFLNQAMEALKSFGGLLFPAKVAVIITLLISSMKVSFLKPHWDKLGENKPFAAPILSLLAGVLFMLVQKPFSWAGLSVWLMSGLGSVALHDILDALKSKPGIKPIYAKIADIFQGLLKKKA